MVDGFSCETAMRSDRLRAEEAGLEKYAKWDAPCREILQFGGKKITSTHVCMETMIQHWREILARLQGNKHFFSRPVHGYMYTNALGFGLLPHFNCKKASFTNKVFLCYR